MKKGKGREGRDKVSLIGKNALEHSQHDPSTLHEVQKLHLIRTHSLSLSFSLSLYFFLYSFASPPIILFLIPVYIASPNAFVSISAS